MSSKSSFYFDHHSESSLLSLISELKNNDDEVKSEAAKAILRYVTSQSRDMSAEHFKRWMKTLLKTHVWNLINSPNNNEKIGGLMVVDQLIDITSDEYTSILANYYRFGLKTSDPQVMKLAAQAIGHMSRISSTITIESVEFDMQRALEWLQGERHEGKRWASCLVLKELAVNSPTLFYGYVPSFVDLIWIALRDVKPSIREAAVQALGAALELISQRESRFRLQWYQKIFEETLRGFNKNANSDWIHASLLTTG